MLVKDIGAGVDWQGMGLKQHILSRSLVELGLVGTVKQVFGIGVSKMGLFASRADSNQWAHLNEQQQLS